MAKFPIIKYVDVNGRNVPFSYPTHELKDGNYAKTGENNPLPTKDSDLKTELELIKQQQQQILERLDNPIDTQLTGSILEDGDAIPVKSTKRLTEIKSHEDAQLIGGGSLYLTDVIRTGDFGSVILLIRWSNGKAPTKFDFKISYYHKSHPSIVTIEDVHSSDEIGNEIKLKSPYFRVLITNRGDTEAEIRTAIVVGG